MTPQNLTPELIIAAVFLVLILFVFIGLIVGGILSLLSDNQKKSPTESKTENDSDRTS